ncbi:MAG: hypothetical protein WDW38_002476 [Sanguina aurantia]
MEERLQEARRTYRLNMGYASLAQLPTGFVELVKRYNPHITELELSSNAITDLPDSLEQFQYLRILRLKYNALRKVPSVITRLPQLMILELSGNQISRLDESIGSMLMLRELDLSGNTISQLPESICNLAKLEVLQLTNNRLELLPDNIGELQSLTKLDISTNSLRFLPASMGTFKKIQRIDCANNILARVPPSMGHLKNLKEFNLRYNSLDDRFRAKVDEGLSRLLAFLRDEEERERLEEIERLKPIGTPVGSYLEYRCKAEVGQVVRVGGGHEPSLDNRCWIRTGHSLTQTGSMLLVFGGQLVKDGSAVNEVFWMTIDRMEWHLQTCTGEKPSPRYNHMAVHDSENHRLIVFGGRTGERKRLNDVHFLDLDTFVWYKPVTEGASPTPREQAVGCFWAGSMVVFGGHAIGGRTNDLFLLELTSWQWTQPPMGGTAPGPRSASAICIGHGNLMFVHGGRNNFVLSDLHMADWVTRTWTDISFDHLYLFGGLDELGAQSFSMYRVHLPPGENYTAAKPEWMEWDSELPYNKCRTCTLYNGTVSVYQLGSNTLGRVNDEDAEKGLVFWDVFKAAKLEVTKMKVLAVEEMKPKNSKRARVAHTINISGKMPRSFSVQSAQEGRVLTYVQDYVRVFEELYPHRRPLYLTPKNECSVPKLVCSTIRPSQLLYTELYDLEGCCSFVADFLAYEALEDPLHPPEYLPSPMSVLNHQAGDCFDLSVVLASLLIGAGYHALVVVGYAPTDVTLNDQSATQCPVLEREKMAAAGVKPRGGEPGARSHGGAAGARRAAAADGEMVQPAHTKYVRRPAVSLQSKVLQAAQEAASKADEIDQTPRSVADDPQDSGGYPVPGGRPTSQGRCKTVHAWVLVMAGKREVNEHVFIEPSSGRRYPVNASPYAGIEYIWNHRNFWVCMQQPEPHSDSRAHPSHTTFDLSNPAAWEAVFEDRSLKTLNELNLEEMDLRQMESRGGTRGFGKTGAAGFDAGMAAMTGANYSMLGLVMKPKTPTLSTRPNSVAAATGGGLSGRAGGRSIRDIRGDGLTPPRTADSYGESRGSEDGEQVEKEWVPTIPPSWVPKLSIPRDAFDMRCPRGSKVQLYFRAQHEIMALFGECSRWDGMVEKLTMFEDHERTSVVEYRENFQRRKDKLRERRVYPKKDTIIEYFDAGSAFGMKDIITVKNESRVINFYTSARLDGLLRREEQEGHKFIETFVNRDDRLVYRSATYVPEGVRSSDAGDSDAALQDDSDPRRRKLKSREVKKVLPMAKMTEKFARFTECSADADVAKRVYYLSDNRIRLEYHFGEDRITNSGKVYNKDGQSHILQIDPLADRYDAGALLEEYQSLLVAEKDCSQAVRDSEWEVAEILRARVTQELNITLDMPYYDIVRIKAEESEEETEEVEESAYDYLSPFLPTLLGMATLSREQALETREKCLKALKDRLIERANIIQARLDEESTALAKRQQNFNRDRDQMSAEEEEEYERASEESMFRISILEKRLKRHEDQALHKYYELDHKLRSDTRLAMLLAAN